MAKQNFIAGGYYGKLGETVGQRWKNIRTIRVYVIPHDPKTPAQLRQRAAFGDAVPYAQIAMRLNHGAPCWKFDGKTEWQARMGTATDRVKMGMSGSTVIPIFPDGYVPYKTLLGARFINNGSGLFSFRFSSGTDFAEPRNALIVLQCVHNVTGEEVEITTEAIFDPAGTALFQLDLGDYSPKDGGEIYGVTTDDNDHEAQMVYLAIQNMTSGGSSAVTDWTVSSFTDTSITLHSDTAEIFAQNHTIPFTLTLWNVRTQSYQQLTQSVTMIAGSGNVNLIVSNKMLSIFGDVSIAGGAGSDVTEDGITYTFPETPIASASPRLINASDIGAGVSVDVTGENTIYYMETIISVAVDCGFSTDVDIADDFEISTFGTWYLSGRVSGSVRQVQFVHTDGEIDDSSEEVIVNFTGNSQNVKFDSGTGATLFSKTLQLDVQNLRISAAVPETSFTVEDA